MPPEVQKESIGERIRRLRKDRNLGQRELADMVGVTDAWISQIEQDKSSASPALLNKIAHAFKVPIREFLQDQDRHMDLASRIKLVEVLLETNQPNEALEILQEFETHPDLRETDALKVKLLAAEGQYQQSCYGQSLATLQPLVHSLEAMNYVQLA